MSATTTDPVTMITPNPAADAVRRRGLRRMRTVAVGLLAAADISWGRVVAELTR